MRQQNYLYYKHATLTVLFLWGLRHILPIQLQEKRECCSQMNVNPLFEPGQNVPFWCMYIGAAAVYTR